MSDTSEQEMARIEPYRGGFTEAQREEFDGQDALIEELRKASLLTRLSPAGARGN